MRIISLQQLVQLAAVLSVLTVTSFAGAQNWVQESQSIYSLHDQGPQKPAEQAVEIGQPSLRSIPQELKPSDLKALIDLDLRGRGTGDGGGGAGVLQIATDQWEAMVRKSIPSYALKDTLDLRGKRRLLRQMIMFAYVHSGYRWSDEVMDFQFREPLWIGRYKDCMFKSSQDWTTAEFSFYGAGRFYFVKSYYTKAFLTILIRLIRGTNNPATIEKDIENLMEFYSMNGAVGPSLKVFQVVVEARLGLNPIE